MVLFLEGSLQNLFCEDHEKNKTYREAGLFLLCKVLPRGSLKVIPFLTHELTPFPSLLRKEG
jgi:hypothetical protein